MSGGGRRGRRGGRRQRRREEHARQQAAQGTQPPQSNGQSGPAQAVLAAPAPADLPPAESAHPRPMSARELVARLEALRAHEAQAATESTATTVDVTLIATESIEAPPGIMEPEPPRAEPRRFSARGGEWIARVAGRGTGGTGRVAQARLEAIRFSPAAEPDSVAAEVIAPHANLDDLYDDELAELLERGLRSMKGNG